MGCRLGRGNLRLKAVMRDLPPGMGVRRRVRRERQDVQGWLVRSAQQQQGHWLALRLASAAKATTPLALPAAHQPPRPPVRAAWYAPPPALRPHHLHSHHSLQLISPLRSNLLAAVLRGLTRFGAGAFCDGNL